MIFDSSKYCVYIVHQDRDSLECFNPYSSWVKVVIVSINMVLRLSATRGCTMHSGSVVDREGDNLVESSVVHLSSIGQVEPGCDGNNILCLCFSLVMSLGE